MATTEKKYRRFVLPVLRRLGIFLLVMWVLTAFWGTKQVHRYYSKLYREGLPKHVIVFEERQSLNEDVPWVLVTDPWAPLPLVVSVEVDSPDSDICFSPRRGYFFWCLGFHQKTPFWTRWISETYE